MRFQLTAFLLSLLAGASLPAQQFETWQDALAGGYTGAQLQRESAAATSDARTERPPLVRFGAGAAYLVELRPADLAVSDRLLSEFCLSFSPLRAVFEIGADMALGRDDRFFVRPNLKLLLVNNLKLSIYLEGQLDLLSDAGGLHVGYGAALGATSGLMENLAVEVVAAAMVFDLPVSVSDGLVGPGLRSDVHLEKSLVVFPYASLRLSARF